MNLALHVWDGLATYYGLSLGVQKGNPILQSCMAFDGVGVTLVGVQSTACLFLLSLHEAALLAVSQWGLVLTAICYFLFSFLPWCVLLFLSWAEGTHTSPIQFTQENRHEGLSREADTASVATSFM